TNYMSKFKVLWTLYFTFMKIGGFTLGGGPAMIPIIHRESVDKHKWVSDEEMLDILALAQSMPGVIAINAATALGIKVTGLLGALAATLGIVTIPLVLIVLIASAFSNLMDYEAVQWAFFGIRAAVAALMVYAVVRLFKGAVKDYFQGALFVAAIMAILVFNVPPQYIILTAAAIAIAFSLLRAKINGGDKV
ncbi:MAG: chromate transporter, partial [Defluviitaleaceae bacterium]|nr:chromate transporter [Defluviitaleaceae bacterium]